MLNPTYPGVYVEEVPSGVRTIAGVSTSTTAFIGYARRGPMDQPVIVQSFADYERVFGGLDVASDVSYAVKQFFLNGGTEAVVVRVAKGATAAAMTLRTAADATGTAILRVVAASPGKWGDSLRLDVDYATGSPGSTFNLRVNEVATVEGKEQVVASETFRNLVVDRNAPNDAVAVVNATSKLVRLDRPTGGAPTGRPRATGTLGSELLAPEDFEPVGDPPKNPFEGKTVTVKVTPAGGGAAVTSKQVTLTTQPRNAAELARDLQAILRAAEESGTTNLILPNATVTAVPAPGGDLLHVVADPASPNTRVEFSGGTLSTATGLGGADSAAKANVAAYALNGAAAGGQASPAAGSDGTVPTAKELAGSRDRKTGLYALENVDLFNILCIPETYGFSSGDGRDDSAAASLAAEATAYCAERRAFYILDIPAGIDPAARDEPAEVLQWLKSNNGLRHKNVATYYPRPRVADPNRGYRLRTVAPSGTLAGLYARTDSERGVWKAPAGTDAVLRGVQELDYTLTDPENGRLNPLAVNCLRTFPVYGNVSWGARTLNGSDQEGSEWKYVPVRRTALYIEESLYRGLKWVVFEPNDEPLWAQIRLNVGTFMHRLFRQGAFQGASPKEAYFVKCDKETTTPDDVNRGVVNIVVGFAPLKPAEFVILKLTQIAAQQEA